MSFFKKDYNLYAPVSGEMIKLENVPDKTFSNKVLGDGVAFKVKGDKVYSPCNGKIILIADTKHALVIENENGVEVMIHIGLDTVELNGKGFELAVKTGEKVKKGQLLVEINKEIMEQNNIDLTTMLILINTNNKKYNRNEEAVVEPGQSVVISF